MEVGICILAFLILWAVYMPWWLAAIVVFVGWTLIKGGTNPFAGIGSAVGGVGGALKRLAIALVVFAITLLAFNRVLGIGSFAVMQELRRLGPFFWAWPANIQLPLIMYMFGASLLFGMVIMAAHGRWKPTMIYFAMGFVLVSAMYFMPGTLSALIPTEKDPATGVVSPSATGIDTALAEEVQAAKKRGVLRRLGNLIEFLAVGEDGIELPSLPTRHVVIVSAPPAPIAPATPIAECSANPTCTMHIGWDTAIRTDGHPIRVKFFGKTDTILLSGEGDDKISRDQFAPGEAEFASEDASTPVQVQLFSAK